MNRIPNHLKLPPAKQKITTKDGKPIANIARILEELVVT